MRLTLKVWRYLFPWIVNMIYVTQRLNELPWLPSPKSAWALAIIVGRAQPIYQDKMLQYYERYSCFDVLWCVYILARLVIFSMITTYFSDIGTISHLFSLICRSLGVARGSYLAFNFRVWSVGVFGESEASPSSTEAVRWILNCYYIS